MSKQSIEGYLAKAYSLKNNKFLTSSKFGQDMESSMKHVNPMKISYPKLPDKFDHRNVKPTSKAGILYQAILRSKNMTLKNIKAMPNNKTTNAFYSLEGSAGFLNFSNTLQMPGANNNDETHSRNVDRYVDNVKVPGQLFRLPTRRLSKLQTQNYVMPRKYNLDLSYTSNSESSDSTYCGYRKTDNF